MTESEVGRRLSSVAPEPSLQECFRHYQQFEEKARKDNKLVLARLNTLLSSQSFLAIAYATSMGSANGRWTGRFALLVTPVLALLGFVLAAAGRSDIDSAKAEAAQWRGKADSLLISYPDLNVPVKQNAVDSAVSARSAGELFAVRAPVIFMIAWTWFFFVPLYLRLT